MAIRAVSLLINVSNYDVNIISLEVNEISIKYEYHLDLKTANRTHLVCLYSFLRPTHALKQFCLIWNGMLIEKKCLLKNKLVLLTEIVLSGYYFHLHMK